MMEKPERKPRKYLSPVMYEEALKLLKSGMKQNDVAEKIGVSQSVISRLYRTKIKPYLEKKREMEENTDNYIYRENLDDNGMIPEKTTEEIEDESLEDEIIAHHVPKRKKKYDVDQHELLDFSWGEDWHSLMLSRIIVDTNNS